MTTTISRNLSKEGLTAFTVTGALVLSNVVSYRCSMCSLGADCRVEEELACENNIDEPTAEQRSYPVLTYTATASGNASTSTTTI